MGVTVIIGRGGGGADKEAPRLKVEEDGDVKLAEGRALGVRPPK